jgi:hypothetical protein
MWAPSTPPHSSLRSKDAAAVPPLSKGMWAACTKYGNMTMMRGRGQRALRSEGIAGTRRIDDDDMHQGATTMTTMITSMMTTRHSDHGHH